MWATEEEAEQMQIQASAEFDEFEEEDYLELTPDCRDMKEWEFEIECIADKVLWDRDFELDDLMVDCSPEKAQFLKSYLGIDDAYFTSISPDPINLGHVRKTLRKLTRAKPR